VEIGPQQFINGLSETKVSRPDQLDGNTKQLNHRCKNVEKNF